MRGNHAAAGLRIARRRADVWGVEVITSPHVPPSWASVYLPPSHYQPGDPPIIIVSDHLDLPGQWIALEIGLAHARFGHRRTDDRVIWRRQQDRAMGFALEQRVPLEQLVRACVYEWTPAELAMRLGVPTWTVDWRVEHLDPWEERLVRLELAG